MAISIKSNKSKYLNSEMEKYLFLLLHNLVDPLDSSEKDISPVDCHKDHLIEKNTVQNDVANSTKIDVE